jgi:dipeptidyl aminopeptidase/acylaminoacyl peptidase
VIVRVYHGVAISGWRHSFDGEAHFYAGHGYASLKPDIVLDGPGLLRQLAGEVVPAVNHLIDIGIADPQRVCLFGHSRGGYDALALITQTNRFCAAVVSAGTANLTSIGHGWGEHGCGGTVWDQRDAYIENSPFFYLDRVRTPLLLICGTAEPEEEMQARHTFDALRRLGKRVELRLYRDEDHSPEGWTEESRHDLTERMLAWFDTFAKAPK